MFKDPYFFRNETVNCKLADSTKISTKSDVTVTIGE